MTLQMQLQPTRHAPTSAIDLNQDDSGSVRNLNADSSEAVATSSTVRNHRNNSIASWKSASKDGLTSSKTSLPGSSSPQINVPAESSHNNSTASFQMSATSGVRSQNSSMTSVVYGRNWEIDMENLLKVALWRTVFVFATDHHAGHVQCGEDTANFATAKQHFRSIVYKPEPWRSSPY